MRRHGSFAAWAMAAGVLAFGSATCGQYIQQWSAQYIGSGSQNDQGMDITADWNGNSYVAGQWFSNASTSAYQIRSYNYDTGTVRWTAPPYLPTWGLAIPRHIALGHMGDPPAPDPAFVYVTGESPSLNGSLQITTLKLNAATGAHVWAKTYANVDYPAGNDVGRFVAVNVKDIQDPNDDIIYVCGYSEGAGTGKDFILLKYNANGTLSATWPYLSAAEPQGVRRYHNTGIDDAVMLVWQVGSPPLDGAPANWVAVAGSSQGIGTGNDIAVRLYDDDDGTVAWTARYDHHNGNDICVGLFKHDGLNTVYATGTSQHYFAGDVPTSDDFVALAYDAATGSPSAFWVPLNPLEPQGVRRYDSGSGDVCYAAATELTAPSTLTLVGSSSVPFEGWNYRWVRWNMSDGGLTWGAQPAWEWDGGVGLDDKALDVVVDVKGYGYITGRAYRAPGQWDYMTIRVDASTGDRYNTGTPEKPDWPQWYSGNGGGNDTGNGIAIYPQHVLNPSVFVAGGAVQIGTGLDWRTQQYKYIFP